MSVAFELDDWGNNVWQVKDREVAEKAMETNPPWFNAGYDKPQNPYLEQKVEMEVVDVELRMADV